MTTERSRRTYKQPVSQVSYSSDRHRQDTRNRPSTGRVRTRTSYDPEELGFDQEDWEQFNRNLDFVSRRAAEERWDAGSGEPYRGIGPVGYSRSDELIFEDVCERLTQHGYLDARRMRVEVNRGMVTLSGAVDNKGAKWLAEDLASEVTGVQDVENRLKVGG